jgi:MFS family permease
MLFVIVGEVFALVVLCPLADVYGRRAIILGGFFLVIVFGILSCFSPNIYYLVVARGLVGVGIGAQQSVAYDLYAEMVPTNLRNRVMYITFFMVFGTEYVILTARYLLEDYGWRYLTGAAALPTLILAMFGYFYIPESPRWLVSQGRYKEAEEVMKTAAIINEIDIGIIVIKETEPEYERNLTDLLQGPFLKQTLLLWTIWTFTYFSMYCIFLSLIRFYSNGDCSYEYGYLSLGIGISVFGIAFATIFVNYSGRVNTQCFLYFGEAIFILLFGITYMYGSHAAAIAMIFLAYTFSSGAASLLWLHTVELFPTEVS